MSVKQMGMVWDLDLAPNHRLVLLAYADHADHDGDNVYPSLERVAHKTGYSRDQVRRISRQLVEAGLMELVEKGHGRGNPHRYRLTLEKGSVSQPFKSKEKVASGKEKVASEPIKGSIAMQPEPSLEPSLEPSVHGGDEKPSPPRKEVKSKEMGNYLLSYLMEQVADKRKQGATVLDPPEKGRIGARFRDLASTHDTETLELAARYMVERAAGEIDPASPYWCFVDTALREVLDGWRPKRALRVVRSGGEPDPEWDELMRLQAEMIAGAS